MKPVNKYYGGKARLAKHLLPLLPPHRVYVEVFGGSGALLFAKPAARVEVINDIDGDVVNFFRVLRDHGKELAAKLRLTPYARGQHEACADLCSVDPVERARRYFVSANQSINGVIDGFWSRGFGNDRTGAFRAKVGAITATARRLQRVQIDNQDFRELVPAYDAPDVLFYLDPPYVRSTRTAPDRYRNEMTDQDHADLLSLLGGIKGKVILSGYACPLYDEMLKGWQRIEFDVPNSAAVKHGAGTTRDRRTEVVWLNFGVSQVDPQGSTRTNSTRRQPTVGPAV